MWCAQHIENNDAEKLCSRYLIVADVYFIAEWVSRCQNCERFKTKARFTGLQPLWDNCVPGFRHCFKQRRSEMLIFNKHFGINIS